MSPMSGGHYDDNGEWQRTKFCFVDCGDQCDCVPPFGQYYSALHDKRIKEESDATKPPEQDQGPPPEKVE